MGLFWQDAAGLGCWLPPLPVDSKSSDFTDDEFIDRRILHENRWNVSAFRSWPMCSAFNVVMRSTFSDQL